MAGLMQERSKANKDRPAHARKQNNKRMVDPKLMDVDVSKASKQLSRELRAALRN